MGTEDSKKYNIGLLMGVFDLFHVGHLRLIQRASACCRYLRVGVLSDDLVEKYKNRRPVIPLDERMEILSAIRGVDTASSPATITAGTHTGNGSGRNCASAVRTSSSSRIPRSKAPPASAAG